MESWKTTKKAFADFTVQNSYPQTEKSENVNKI